MTDENTDMVKVKDIIDATTGLVKAIPVYEDALQPAAKELGKTFETVVKTINLALAPLSGTIWAFEKIKDYVSDSLARKLSNVKSENIITPDIMVVGPAFEALRYSGQNKILRELYANLIANSMDKETVEMAHPSFVEIIKNLTSEEALIIQSFIPGIYKPIMDFKLKFKSNGGESNLLTNISTIGEEAGCKSPIMTPKYIDNLCRLGILHIPPGRSLTDKDFYLKIRNMPEVLSAKLKSETEHTSIVEEEKYVELTEFGMLFQAACVRDKS